MFDVLPNSLQLYITIVCLLLLLNSTLDYFFNNPRVKEALHAPKHIEWRVFQDQVSGDDWSSSNTTTIATISDAGSAIPWSHILQNFWTTRKIGVNGDRDLSIMHRAVRWR
jgi:hypothetical protein